MKFTDLSFEKTSVQLLKPSSSSSTKPSLTNVAICSGCHGCGGGTRISSDPITNPVLPENKIGF
jgi:hypothetical protein